MSTYPQSPAAHVDRAALARAAGPRPARLWAVLDYDTRRFPFAAALSRDVFKVRRLDRLHVHLKQRREKRGGGTRLSHRDNLTVRAMMQDQPKEADFWKIYHGFMLRALPPWVGRALSYTSNPKLRAHLAGTPSVSSFHHDICVTERIDQVNFWLPFNDVGGDATLWLESDYGKGDFLPVPVNYGQALIFDGGYLGHGSVFNGSDVTRLSLDMRFSYKGATTRAEGVELMNRIVAVAGQAVSGQSNPPGGVESVRREPR